MFGVAIDLPNQIDNDVGEDYFEMEAGNNGFWDASRDFFVAPAGTTRQTFNYGTPFMTCFPDDGEDNKSISFHPIDEPLLNSIVTTTCPTFRPGRTQIKQRLPVVDPTKKNKSKSHSSYDLSTISNSLAYNLSVEASKEVKVSITPPEPSEIDRVETKLEAPEPKEATTLAGQSKELVELPRTTSANHAKKLIESPKYGKIRPYASARKLAESNKFFPEITTTNSCVPSETSTAASKRHHEQNILDHSKPLTTSSTSEETGSRSTGDHDSRAENAQGKNNYGAYDWAACDASHSNHASLSFCDGHQDEAPLLAGTGTKKYVRQHARATEGDDSRAENAQAKNGYGVYDIAASDDVSHSNHASFGNFCDEYQDEAPLLAGSGTMKFARHHSRPLKAARRFNTRQSLPRLGFSTPQLKFRRRALLDTATPEKYSERKHKLKVPAKPVVRQNISVQPHITHDKSSSKRLKTKFEAKRRTKEGVAVLDAKKKLDVSSSVRKETTIVSEKQSANISSESIKAAITRHRNQHRTKAPTSLSYDDLQARFDSEHDLHDELDQFVQNIAVPARTIKDGSAATSKAKPIVVVETLRAPLDEPLDVLYEDDDEDSDIISYVPSTCSSFDYYLGDSKSKKSLEDHFSQDEKVSPLDECDDDDDDDDEGTGFLLGVDFLDAENPIFSESSTSRRQQASGTAESEPAEYLWPDPEITYESLLGDGTSETSSEGDDEGETERKDESDRKEEEHILTTYVVVEERQDLNSIPNQNCSEARDRSNSGPVSVDVSYESSSGGGTENDLILPINGSELSVLTDDAFPDVSKKTTSNELVKQTNDQEEESAEIVVDKEQQPIKRGGLLRGILHYSGTSKKDGMTSNLKCGKLAVVENSDQLPKRDDVTESRETPSHFACSGNDDEKREGQKEDHIPDKVNNTMMVFSEDDDDSDPFQGLHCITRMVI